MSEREKKPFRENPIEAAIIGFTLGGVVGIPVAAVLEVANRDVGMALGVPMVMIFATGGALIALKAKN